MSSLHRRSLTRRLGQPSLAPSRRSRFWPGPLRGTKVRVLEVCGPEPGRRALLTVHLRGERASGRPASPRPSLAASPLPFIHSPAGSDGCGWRPGRGGSSRWGAGGGRDGAGRHPPIQRRGWPPPPVLVRRLGGAQWVELCPATPHPLSHWWAASRTPPLPCPPLLSSPPQPGARLLPTRRPGSQDSGCRGHPVDHPPEFQLLAQTFCWSLTYSPTWSPPRSAECLKLQVHPSSNSIQDAQTKPPAPESRS